MNFLGVDPGERWLGLAGLVCMSHRWHAHIMVVDMKGTAMYDNVDLFRRMVGEETRVVCEDYRVRPQGHNRFSGHATLKLIGALHFVTEDRKGTFHLVPPGPPESLTEIAFGERPLQYWRERWKQFGNPNWNHGMSAWRALAYFLHKHYPHIGAHLRPGSPMVREMTYDIAGINWFNSWPNAPLTAPRVRLLPPNR